MATVMQQDVFNLEASQTDTESLRQKNIQGLFFSDESRFQVPEDISDLTLKPNVTAKKTGIKTLSHLLK